MKRLASVIISFALLALASAVFAADKAPAKAAPAPIDSLALLEKAVAKDSTKFDNLYKLGVLYLEREKMPEAAKVFAKANSVKPKQVKVLVKLGVSLDAVGKADEAQSFYKDALVVTPDDSVAMCRLASSLYAQGKYDEAMGNLRTLIQKKPRSHCAYFTMGVAFADAGIYRDAIRMWRKVIELAPDSPEALSAKESIEVLERFLAGK